MPKRLSVSLDPADETVVRAHSQPGPERDALCRLIRDPGASEGATIRALMRLGADVVREHLLEQGYAEMAAEQDAHAAERRSLRERRVKRDADRD